MSGHCWNRRSYRALAASTALGAALCGLGASSALAVSQQEADELRQEIEDFMRDTGVPAWSFRSGTVTVDVINDGYTIVIPDPVLVFDEGRDHAEIELEDTTIRMVPDPVDDSLFDMDVRFGSGGDVRFTINGDSGERAFFDIGSHKISGVWSDEVSYFTDAEISLEDILVRPDTAIEDAPDFRLSIGAMTGVSQMDEVEPGLWDGDGTSVIENVVVIAEGQEVFRLAEFAMTQTVGGFAFNAYMDWVANNPAIMGEEPEFASEEEAQTFFKQLIIDFPTILDDFSVAWTLTGLDAGEPGERVLIDRHEFELSATGLAGDLSDWHLRAFLTDMSVPSPEVPPQFVPSVLDVDLTLSDLPTGLGWNALEDAVGGAEIRDMDQIGPMLGQQILQLALQSESGANLGGEIDWQTGNVLFEGEVHADASSPLMASGGLSVIVTEMQAFIQEVESAFGAEPASGLTMLQAFGQQEDGENGPQTVYEFQISGSSVLMNGQDLEPIMMMLGQ